jgi:hypothetical protein
MAVRSALLAGRPLHYRKIPSTHFCWRLSRPQGHSAAGRIRSLDKSSDLIGNRSRDLPACNIVLQPTIQTKLYKKTLFIFSYVGPFQESGVRSAWFHSKYCLDVNFKSCVIVVWGVTVWMYEGWAFSALAPRPTVVCCAYEELSEVLSFLLSFWT